MIFYNPSFFVVFSEKLEISQAIYPLTPNDSFITAIFPFTNFEYAVTKHTNKPVPEIEHSFWFCIYS